MTLIRVALPLPLDRLFTYSLKDGEPVPARGARVVVGFGRRRLVGFAVDTAEEAPEGVRLRRVERVVDVEPVLSETEWTLAEWMARYYVAPLGLVLRLFYPAGSTGEAEDGRTGGGAPRRLHVLPADDPGEEERAAVLGALARAPQQRRAWMAALELDAPIERSAFCEALGVSEGVVAGLATRGLLRLEEREVTLDPYGAVGTLPDVIAEGEPSAEQRAAIEAIRAALADPGRSEPFLLQGVTGSGKTRVYEEAVAAVVGRGGRAIVLVPEIGLAAPTVARFRSRFGDRVAVLHSGLSRGERASAWNRVRSGAAPIAIGARSALFAPVGRADLVVVDEEHETAYKQDETPRYLARDVAVYRAAIEGGVVVLGSATPSLESRARADAGKYRRLRLPGRIAGRPLPSVGIVDLAREGALVGPGLSDVLVEALGETLAARDQALLFLNRRGFASFVQCTDCGWVGACPNCRISLTYHRRAPRLQCHYCDHREPVPDACPSCAGRRLDTRGLGTQQVEAAVAARFPEARIARMDLDTTGPKWSHARLYRAMQSREIDVLVGTQMIAKGFDLPGVALVGVVSADTALHFPDFRSSERTFQLLVQVAGRAGRGDAPGRVLFQTWLPEHFVLTAAAAHDYESFYRRERKDREALGYPPSTRLANVVVSGPDEEPVAEAIVRVAEKARGTEGLTVVGPAPAPLERLRGRWRHHVLLKASGPQPLDRALRDLARREEELVGGSNRLEIDRDPLGLL
ncbi:MAG TPA: primosomal protein N' [Gemmatimonadota bacterium]|nr:primosomal protein N' [Gemmatimonadota bacterium]